MNRPKRIECPICKQLREYWITEGHYCCPYCGTVLGFPKYLGELAGADETPVRWKLGGDIHKFELEVVKHED